jgi:hypothetical protein
MIKLIRKHQKKVAAFFGVALMVAFAATSNTNHSNTGPGKQQIAKMNDGPIYNTDQVEARREWVALTRNVMYDVQDPRTGQMVPRPIVYKYLPESTVNELAQKPEMFLLLLREAIDAGVQPNKDDLADIMTNHYFPQPGTDEDPEVVADGVANLLRISANFSRMASNIKISQPARDLALAKALQKIQLNVVELAASRYSSKVAAPTTQAVQEQFNKYANVDSGKPDAKDNPFGFGYRLADRVKLQYLQIDRAAAEKIVEATKTPYDWDVDARLYYLRHQEEFPTTQAVTKSGAAATATTRPYEDVRDAALRSVRQPVVDKLVLDVQNKILATLQSDWRTWSTASGATSLAEPYPSYAYLQKLSQTIEAEFKLRVFVTDQDRDFLSATELAALPGIGSSSVGSVSFADDAMDRAKAFLASSGKDASAAKAQLLSASEAEFDQLGNVYIYRLTDARPAEPAPDVASVAGKIESDLRLEAAYQLAMDQAKTMLTAARAGTLAKAVAGTGLSITDTDPFSIMEPYLGNGISLSDGGTKVFIDEAFKLLVGYDPKATQHPTEVIEVPADEKVYVAQLASLKPVWTDANFYLASAEVGQGLQREELAELAQQWLSYDQVVKRTGYQVQSSKS